MDLTAFTKGDVNKHPTQELMMFHKEKMLSSEGIDSLRVSNLRHFLDVCREYSPQLSLSVTELFNGSIFEGYCTVTQNTYNTILPPLTATTPARIVFTPDEEKAFTEFQMVIPFVLRNDYSNLTTYMPSEEATSIREQIVSWCEKMMDNESLSLQHRFNIADCLEATGIQSLVRITRGFHQEHREHGPKKKAVYGEIETDSQNVHSKTVALVTQRKIKIIATDSIPNKQEFYHTIYPHLQLQQTTTIAEEKKEEKKEEPLDVDEKLLIYPPKQKYRWLGYVRPDGKLMSPEEIAKLPTVKVPVYFGVKDKPVLTSQVVNIPEMAKDASVTNRIKIAMGLLADPESSQQFTDVSIVLQSYFETMIMGYVNHQEKSEKIEKALTRIKNDTVMYEKMTLSDIFQRVLNRVFKMRDKDFFCDLIQRVYEELQESEGFCATGYASRLLNILSGYPDIDIQVSDSRVEELSTEIRMLIEKDRLAESNAEEIEDSMIGISKKERQLFVTFCKSRLVKWHNTLVDEYKKQDRFDECFEEEFRQTVYKTCGIQLNASGQIVEETGPNSSCATM